MRAASLSRGDIRLRSATVYALVHVALLGTSTPSDPAPSGHAPSGNRAAPVLAARCALTRAFWRASAMTAFLRALIMARLAQPKARSTSSRDASGQRTRRSCERQVPDYWSDLGLI